MCVNESLIVNVDFTGENDSVMTIGKCKGINTEVLNVVEGPLAEIVYKILRGEIKQ